MTFGRRLTAEGLATALLLAAVVGSGIMGERLAGGNVALALLANTLATGAMLVVLILTFGPISGAHMNPAVTLAAAAQGGFAWREVPGYLGAQVGGAFAGVALADLMFELPAFALSRHARAGAGQLLSECVATFGLLAVIRTCAQIRSGAVPYAVGAYVTAAYWFTASTAFANPAVTLARSVTDTFAGIRPLDVPGFLVAQLVGATAATALVRWLLPMTRVIFACVHNAGRSQMAAALFNDLADPTKAQALSAGTEPAAGVHPEVVDVMREVGIDLSGARPRLLTDELAAGAQLLVTMGCGDRCPVVPGLQRDDWPLADPKGQPREHVRAIRDEIGTRVQALLARHDWQRSRR